MNINEQLDLALGGCGANAPGGGGFQKSNSCATGTKGTFRRKNQTSTGSKKKKKVSPWADWKPKNKDDHSWDDLDDPDQWDIFGEFETDDGRTIDITAMAGLDIYNGGYEGSKAEVWHNEVQDAVGYSAEEYPREFYDFSFRAPSGYKITGKGGGMGIFRKATKSLVALAETRQPAIIKFTADNREPSRVKLYKFLAKKTNKFMPDYEAFKTYKESHETTFVLVRKDARIDHFDLEE